VKEGSLAKVSNLVH